MATLATVPPWLLDRSRCPAGNTAEGPRRQKGGARVLISLRRMSPFALYTPLEFGDAGLQLGDPLVLGPALLPPAVPDPLLELHRAIEDPPVVGLDPGALLLDPPLHTPPV
jgi:hypothetical protein